jgi:ArsR family transcriptional regulator
MRALADPTRLLVLDQIMRAPCCELAVTDIAAALGISLPNASYHLKILAGAGVLARWRLGTSVSYSIAPANRQLVKFLLGRCRQP